jgi:hypothetical protein
MFQSFKKLQNREFHVSFMTGRRLSVGFNYTFNIQWRQKKMFYPIHCIEILFSDIQTVGEQCTMHLTPNLSSGHQTERPILNLLCTQINVSLGQDTEPKALMWGVQLGRVCFFPLSVWLCTEWKLAKPFGSGSEFTALSSDGVQRWTNCLSAGTSV